MEKRRCTILGRRRWGQVRKRRSAKTAVCDQMTASDVGADMAAGALKMCGDAVDAGEQQCDGRRVM
jgi:hypothetical protein